MTEQDLVNPDEAGSSEETIDGSPGSPEEVVDGLPVLAEVRQLQPALSAPLPTAQAAAIAATGFLAGAVTMALVKRLGRRKPLPAKLPPAQGRPAQVPPAPASTGALPVLGSRTYLVHVRVLAKSGE